MRQFRVYRNPDREGYLLDIQTDRIHDLQTRIVVPLLPLRSGAAIRSDRLSPQFLVGGEETVMVTQYLAAVPIQLLRHPVADLSSQQDRIKAALDLLLFGV